MNFPKQNHKTSLNKIAEKYNISFSSAYRIAKEMNATKTREQYEKDAQKRREIVYNLRQQGLKFREIGEMLGISTNNAQQLARRFQPEQ